ncbi:DUF6349 family protein [uncultured Microbacterium sp.]|uniref:DUF6349 family protein n=1 Tax=uncultured Microbacterium sp. TaxID=191216 RepID=UPI00260E2A6D|nr:DUF6349 family protein [uncultured Microbacterium sp.]
MNTTLSLSDAIDQLLAEDKIAGLPAWEGTPLGFTSRYYSAADLDAAAERRALVDATKPWHDRTQHGWRADYCGVRAQFGTHTIATYTADTRCLWDYHQLQEGQRPRLVSERIPCECIGGLLHLIVCDTCELHWIHEDENAVVEAWNDHAYPGWRNLPILPAKLRGQMGTRKMTPKLEEWFEANYPAQFHVPGAPILTDRGGSGTRHVPEYSPYGGYDIAVDGIQTPPAVLSQGAP